LSDLGTAPSWCRSLSCGRAGEPPALTRERLTANSLTLASYRYHLPRVGRCPAYSPGRLSTLRCAVSTARVMLLPRDRFQTCAMSLPSSVIRPTPQVAAGHFEASNQVVASGDYSTAFVCCSHAAVSGPGQSDLSTGSGAAHKSSSTRTTCVGSRLAWLTLRNAQQGQARRLAAKTMSECSSGRTCLTRNPWEVRHSMAMAEAADDLACSNLAVWNSEHARMKAH